MSATTATYRRDTEHGPAYRTITTDERGNVTMTAAEAHGLLKLARYSLAPDADLERAIKRDQAVHKVRRIA